MPLVSKAIDRIIEGKETGIWHVSATQEISYHEAAIHVAESIGANVDCIEPNLVRENNNSPRRRISKIFGT